VRNVEVDGDVIVDVAVAVNLNVNDAVYVDLDVN
jgi:hypothetical protein